MNGTRVKLGQVQLVAGQAGAKVPKKWLRFLLSGSSIIRP